MADNDPSDVIARAVIAKWQAEATLNGIPGPFRQEKHSGRTSNPAVGTNFPYCVLVDGEARLATQSSESEYWESIISFHVYVGLAPENLKNEIDKIRTIFDSRGLVLTFPTGWSLVGRRSLSAKEVKDDKAIWHAELSYKLTFSRGRPV